MEQQDPFAWLNCTQVATKPEGAGTVTPAPAAPAASKAATTAGEVATATPDPATAERRALVAEALAATRRAVKLIHEELIADADYEDAVRALPVLHKVIEHSERMEVARRENRQWQPAIVTLNFAGDASAPLIQVERPATPIGQAQPEARNGLGFVTDGADDTQSEEGGD